MSKILEVRPSEELAYWIGVAQSDGCLTRYIVKRIYRKNTSLLLVKENRAELEFRIASKSLPMVERFKEISQNIWNRYGKLRLYEENYWAFHIGVKSLLPLFEKLDIKLSRAIFMPPNWTLHNSKYFGAYLAGLIDGDGNTYVKRPKYPECVIEISSGSYQPILANTINKVVGCNVHQYKRHRICFSKKLNRTIEGTSCKLAFYVSSKNAKFVFNYLLPHMQLKYKKRIIYDFIINKYSTI